MKTINFTDYTSDAIDTAYAFSRLSADLRGQCGVRVVFDSALYEVTDLFCSERDFRMSNHGQYIPKRIAMLIEDASDIELDFCGSTLRTVGKITAIAVNNCQNITVKNLTLENPSTQFMQANVVSHGDGFIDLEPTHGKDEFIIRKGEMFAPAYNRSFTTIQCYVEYDPEVGELAHGIGANSFGNPTNLSYEQLDNGLLRIHNITRYPPIGRIIIINGAQRYGSAVFCQHSRGLTFENITIHSCYGMGFIAQVCEDIHLNSFSTKRHGDQIYTANADATHFVNCRGSVLVENCLFEGQLDDALNIHGFYTSIIGKCKNELFVRLMHEEAKGLRIYKPGDRIQILPRSTLLPYAERTVKEVEYLNIDVTRLVLDETTDGLEIGHAVENISCNASLTFRNNTVRDNRARSMLVAARGKVLIENNLFHATGTGIYFESDGVYWYESGATSDVTIRRNHFDRCKYCGWGEACISGKPREAVEDGRFFHKKIEVADNRFTMLKEYTELAAVFDNFETVVFRDNVIEGRADIKLRHVGNYDIQNDVTICEE